MANPTNFIKATIYEEVFVLEQRQNYWTNMT